MKKNVWVGEVDLVYVSVPEPAYPLRDTLMSVPIGTETVPNVTSDEELLMVPPEPQDVV